MKLLELVEDRPTPKAVYNWRIYVCAAVVSFAACMIGYDSAFIGTAIALPSFIAEFSLDSYSSSERALISANIVSVYQAGAFFGSIFAYASSYFLGRRKSLWIFSVLFIAGAGGMLAANAQRGVNVIVGTRILAGIGVGGASNLVPIYISELAPPAVRGRLVGMYEMGWQIGGLVGFWINYGVSKTLPATNRQWLIPFAVQLIPAGLLLIGSIWVPESPRWLFVKGRRAEATKVLCWLRQLPAEDTYILQEIAYIDEDISRFNDEVGAGFFKPFRALKKRAIQWRFFLGGMLFLWQNATGINAINYYSPTVFKTFGITGTSNGFLTTGIFGVVKTCLTAVWLLYLIDHVGRRNLLLFGSLGGSVCMWIIGAFVKIANTAANPSGKMTPDGVAAIFFFYLWTAIYTPSWNGTPWVINSEMFDHSTRSLGQASAAANNWLWNFLISRFTPQMFLKMGYGVYFFFAALMVCSFFFVFFFVPETKAIPLEEMDRLFATTPVRKAHHIVMDELHTRNGALQDDEGEKATAVEYA